MGLEIVRRYTMQEQELEVKQDQHEENRGPHFFVNIEG